MSKRSWVAVVVLALAVILIDQSVKYVVRTHMYLGESIPAHGFFRITYVRNAGMAFGLFRDQGLLLTFGSLIGVGLMLWYFRKNPMRGILPLISLGLLLGGAVGNLTDRIHLGSVVDFIHVGPWPIFNLADSSIVTGVIILLFLILRSQGEDSSQEDQERVDSGEPHRLKTQGREHARNSQ